MDWNGKRKINPQITPVKSAALVSAKHLTGQAQIPQIKKSKA
jgi:hypothetical protein